MTLQEQAQHVEAFMTRAELKKKLKHFPYPYIGVNGANTAYTDLSPGQIEAIMEMVDEYVAPPQS
jgi:hypothetical protein